jgi:hypothetical protein
MCSRHDLCASSPALCTLDRNETCPSSREVPCSSESEQSCLFRNHSRGLLIENCCSESLDKTASSVKSAKRKRAEDLLEREYAGIRRRETAPHQKRHISGREKVAWVDACVSHDCSVR